MEEFVENFNEFKDWLENKTCSTPDEAKAIAEVRVKFEELGLNNSF